MRRQWWMNPKAPARKQRARAEKERTLRLFPALKDRVR